METYGPRTPGGGKAKGFKIIITQNTVPGT